MKQKTIAIINDKLIIIDRYYYESDEMFYFRLKYIIDNYNEKIYNEKIDFEDLIGLSKIEQEKKFNGCKF